MPSRTPSPKKKTQQLSNGTMTPSTSRGTGLNVLQPGLPRSPSFISSSTFSGTPLPKSPSKSSPKKRKARAKKGSADDPETTSNSEYEDTESRLRSGAEAVEDGGSTIGGMIEFKPLGNPFVKTLESSSTATSLNTDSAASSPSTVVGGEKGYSTARGSSLCSVSEIPVMYGKSKLGKSKRRDTRAMTPDDENGMKQHVSVCVRVRPPSSDAPTGDDIWNLDVTSGRIGLSEKHPLIEKRGSGMVNQETYDFSFDSILEPLEPTSTLFETQISPVVKAAMEGFNGTVFAYGQTGSGKTHTMMGNEDEPGIIPQAVHEIFDYIKSDTRREFLLRVSYLEIYNETLKDLLSHESPNDKNPLKIHEDKESGRIYVAPLQEEIVTTPIDVMDLISKGEEGRHVGSTDFNSRSSRSHCVFSMIIESRERSSAGSIESTGPSTPTTNVGVPPSPSKTKFKVGSSGAVRISQLNLIDLAGSERATSQEERRKEGAFINKSLLALGTVIGKLTEENRSENHIPYRDSKLTRLLQTSLSGNARVAIVCTLSLDPRHAVESVSTLKFARRAKRIVTKAERGEMIDNKAQALLQKYQQEIETLRARLNSESAQIESSRSPRVDEEAVEEENRRIAELKTERERAEEEVRRLKEQLTALNGLILTGPAVEENVRRISIESGGFLSPKSIATPGTRRRLSEMMIGGGLVGFGTPKRKLGRISSALDAIPSPKIGTIENEIALERELDGVKKVGAQRAHMINEKDETISDLQSQLEDVRKQFEDACTRRDEEEAERNSRMADLESQLVDLRSQLETASQNSSQLEQVRQELVKAQEEAAEAQKEGQARVVELEENVDRLQKDLAKAAEDSDVISELRGRLDTATKEAETEESKHTERTRALEEDLSREQEKVQSAQAQMERVQQELDEVRKASDSERTQWTTKFEELEAKLVEAGESLKLALERETEVASSRDEKEASLVKLQHEISEQSSQLSKLEDSLASLTSDLQDARSETKNAESALERVEKEFADSKGDQTELASAKSQLEVVKAELEEEKAQLSSKVRTLEEEVAQARAKIEAVEGERDLSKSTITRLEGELTQALTDKSSLEVTVRKGGEDLRSSNAENERLSKELEEKATGKAELEAAKDQLEVLVSRLQNEASDKDAKVDELSSDLTAAQRDASSATSRIAELVSTSQKLEQARDKGAELNVEQAKRITDLEEQLAISRKETEAARSAASAQTLDLEALKQELHEARTNLTSNETERSKRITDLEIDLTSSRDSLRVAGDEKEALLAQHLAVEKARGELETRLEASSKQVSSLESERAGLIADLGSARMDNARLEDDILQNGTKLAKLEKDLEEAKAQLSIYESSSIQSGDLLKQQEASVSALRSEIGSLNAQFETSKSMLDDAMGTNEAEINRLKQELADARERNQSVESNRIEETKKLQTRIAEEESHRKAAEEQGRERLTQVRKDLDSAQAQVEKLRVENQSLAAEVRSRESQMNRSEVELAKKTHDLEVQVSNLSRTNEDARLQLKERGVEVEKLTRELATMEANMPPDLSHECGQLRKDVRDKEAVIVELRNEVAKLTDKNRRELKAQALAPRPGNAAGLNKLRDKIAALEKGGSSKQAAASSSSTSASTSDRHEDRSASQSLIDRQQEEIQRLSRENKEMQRSVADWRNRVLEQRQILERLSENSTPTSNSIQTSPNKLGGASAATRRLDSKELSSRLTELSVNTANLQSNPLTRSRTQSLFSRPKQSDYINAKSVPSSPSKRDSTWEPLSPTSGSPAPLPLHPNARESRRERRTTIDEEIRQLETALPVKRSMSVLLSPKPEERKTPRKLSGMHDRQRSKSVYDLNDQAGSS